MLIVAFGPAMEARARWSIMMRISSGRSVNLKEEAGGDGGGGGVVLDFLGDGKVLAVLSTTRQRLSDLSDESLGLLRWLFAVVVVLAGATVGGLSSFSSGRWVEFLIEQLG